MAATTLSKPAPNAPSKPALHPEAHTIIMHARQQLGGVMSQLQALDTFLFNTAEDGEIYDFSCALSTILRLTVERVREIHKTMGAAAGYVREEEFERLPWKQKSQ